MTVGELQRFLDDVREDVDVLMDFNGNGREPVRCAAVVTDDDLLSSIVLTNMEDYEAYG